jgi:23S rRNA (pseudouridine1915-N3)-methyltransferase
MRIAIAAVGKVKPGPDRELAERYRDRAAKAGRSLGFKTVEITELPESRAPRIEDRLAEEAAAIARAIPEEAVRVALDGSGILLTSDEFAARIRDWRDAGRPSSVFIIGGPDGLSPGTKSRADLVLSFGKVTWPHQLVRIMLLEQLYRAVTILSGHPYHRA